MKKSDTSKINAPQQGLPSISGTDEIQQTMNTASSHLNNLADITNSFDWSSFATLTKASSHQNTLAEIIKKSSSLSSFATLAEASSHQNTLAEIIKKSSSLSSFAALATANTCTKTVNEIINNSSFQQAVNALTEQSNLLKAFDIIAHSHRALNTELIKQDIDRQLQEIGEAKNSDSFLKIFSALHPTIQGILLFFTLQLLLPIAQNIAANLITPHVEKLISAPETTEREKVKQLKSFSLDELDLSNLRFVTTELLVVREYPSTRSRIKDELQFGQVVTMVNKQRNWMEISYTHEDGEIMHGWAFSRYTGKFRK